MRRLPVSESQARDAAAPAAAQGSRGRRVVVMSVGVVVAAVLLLLSAWLVTRQDDPIAARRAEVAHKGATVMPFDLAKTRHVFGKGVTGGVQTVTANHAGDTDQVALIRSHLQAERGKFARGDFGDPASIHGEGCPVWQCCATGSHVFASTTSRCPTGRG